jgi:hypothetical protein
LSVLVELGWGADGQRALRRGQWAPGVSRRIGLGEFARFPYRHGSWLGRLLLRRTYRPERLLKRLAPHLARPDNRIAGLHLYTFNEIERAERWRHETIARLAGHDLWWKPSAWMAVAHQATSPHGRQGAMQIATTMRRRSIGWGASLPYTSHPF